MSNPHQPSASSPSEIAEHPGSADTVTTKPAASEPQSQTSDETGRKPRGKPRREIRQDDAEKILEAHADWLKTDRKSANGRADFVNAHCIRVNFNESLAQASFQGATLTGCTFADNVDLAEADFSEADLKGVDLSRTRNLSEHRLGASNLAYATLPRGITFSELGSVKQMAQHAEKLLFALVAACATVFVLTRIVPDQQLFQPAQSITLPVLGLPVPIRTFFNLTPWLLLVLYAYFLATLLKLWDAMRDLPAILPNNRLLFREITASPNFSVMPFGWCWRSFPQGERTDEEEEAAELTRATWLDRLLVIAAVWCLVPATVVWLWFSYLPRHSVMDTRFHVLAAGVAVGLSVASYGRMVGYLTRGLEEWKAEEVKFFIPDRKRAAIVRVWLYRDRKNSKRRRLRLDVVAACAAATILVLAFASKWALLKGSCDNDSVRHGDRQIRCYELAANLERADLDSLVMSETNLRRAFLYGASLRGTELEYARLDGAQMSDVDARGAKMKDADLDHAVLWEATLAGAELKEAKLRHADLRGASLAGARLQGAKFNGADLRGANFQGAIVCGADFRDTGETFAAVEAGPAHGIPLARRSALPFRTNGAPIDPTVPSYLSDGERLEFLRWLRAEAQIEALGSFAASAAASGRLPRDELIRRVDEVDVSMGAKTQRTQHALSSWLGAYPSRNGQLPYTRAIRAELAAFIDDVQDKARNHCVLPARIELPENSLRPRPFFGLVR